jgi:acyl-CoA hydrolase
MRALLDLFRPGRTIYLPGASGEALALADALAADPGRMKGVHVVSCLLPGFNAFDYAALDPQARLTTFLFVPALRASFDEGRVRVLPLAYSGVATYLGGRVPLDVAIAHVAPPGADGLCSVGIAADFTPIAWPRAKHRALIVNHAMPAMRHGPRLALADADVVVEVDHPLPTTPPPTPNAIIDRIAATTAGLVPDGAAIQVGIGGAPGAVLHHLAGHRGLTLASGLVSHGFDTLLEGGALDPDGDHRAGIAYGDEGFYRFLANLDHFRLAPVLETHMADRLAGVERFTAINSALEVDLFGQANLEWVKGRMASGAGGAPDFARGAMRSPGGRSIVALPATASGGRISRLVSRIDAPTVSLGRADIDTIVTEHGVADLRDRSLDERAEALIAIADPDHRARLAGEWSAIRASL